MSNEDESTDNAKYKFKIDRKEKTWRCLDKDGEQVTNGELPLTDSKRAMAVFAHEDIEDPVRSAFQTYISKDWTTEKEEQNLEE